MKRAYRHVFHIYHPAVVFAYLAAALVFAMLSFHPVHVAISVFAGAVYALYLQGWHRFRKVLAHASLLWLLIALINPIFSSGGATVLFYLFGRVVTREALFYGMATGGMLMAVLLWMSCYRSLISNEKFLFLFGKAFPALSLMLCMVFRFLPVTRERARQIRMAQKGLGLEQGGWRRRLFRGLRVLSVLMSWTMENSIETADSMKARGYGRPGRTSYSPFVWHRHDTLFLPLLLGLIALNLVLILQGSFDYFPLLQGSLRPSLYGLRYGAYALFLGLPLLLETRETIRWSF